MSRDGLRARLEGLADTVDSYCDHEDDDPTCLDSLHALSQTIRDEAAALAEPEPGLDVERLKVLLNSLGIVGPNIIHAEQGMWPDGKHSDDDTWDGPGSCVCRRVWPCEAKAVGDLIALAEKLEAGK